MSKHILCIATLLTLSACEGGNAGPSSAQDAPTIQPQIQTFEPSPVVTPEPSPSASPTAATIALEVRSYTETRYPQHAWPTQGYTATGYCATYNNETYCWDDGIKSMTFTANQFSTTNQYSFWNINGSGAPVGGVMAVDGMAQPRVISPNLTLRIATAQGTADKVGAVLLFGIPSMVSCVEDHGTLDCGSFSIDTLQVAL